MYGRSFGSALSLLWLCVVPWATSGAAEARLRRPVALAVSADGRQLFTANRESGTLSVLDLVSRSVVDEISIGGRLSDVQLADERLLVLDEQNHQLVSLTASDTGWQISDSIDLPQHPQRIVFDPATQTAYVSSSWSRRLSKIALPSDGTAPRLVGSLTLDFEPLEICLTDDGNRLIAAGAFAAHVAVIDTGPLQVLSSRSLTGHNIRGLAWTAQQLVISMQELNPLAYSTRDDVHWGNMLANQLVHLPQQSVFDPLAELDHARIATPLGGPGEAAGDPGKILLAPDGRLLVLLSGVGQISIAEATQLAGFRYVQVAQRPVSLVLSDGVCYVANMFSDCISIVDPSQAVELARIELGEQPELSASQRGELLFFDSRLSLDGWMSCHSCHTEGHTNDQLNDNLSDGSFGAAKHVPSLLGVAHTGPWAWDASVASLQQQVSNSIANTMHGTPLEAQQMDDLLAYMHTLEPPDSSWEPPDERLTKRGKQIFQSQEMRELPYPPRLYFLQDLRRRLGRCRRHPAV